MLIMIGIKNSVNSGNLMNLILINTAMTTKMVTSRRDDAAVTEIKSSLHLFQLKLHTTIQDV